MTKRIFLNYAYAIEMRRARVYVTHKKQQSSLRICNRNVVYALEICDIYLLTTKYSPVHCNCTEDGFSFDINLDGNRVTYSIYVNNYYGNYMARVFVSVQDMIRMLIAVRRGI